MKFINIVIYNNILWYGLNIVDGEKVMIATTK